ncbi:hypothetical protein NKJ87_10205 [Mesorhizobium sp. M0027]|uniref:hypothetical protein n=1 Tax=unclassified Mesorhizobium TaxID=325217 RepID=UPI0012EB35BA|nr:hypothetical protein [Mesorhizobium sp. LSHC420B00]
MDTEYASEEIWRTSLAAARSYFRHLQTPENLPYAAKSISHAIRRIERIRAAGLPEWQERDRNTGFP